MTLHAYEQLSSASEWYAAAMTIAPSEPRSFYLLGVVEAGLGRQASAVDALRRALTLDQGYLPARVRLADALLRSGNLKESEVEYSRLAAEHPDLAVAHFGLGQVAAATGHDPDAARWYRRAVELVPEFGAAQYALALSYRALGDRALAEQHLAAYRKWGDRAPALADPWLDAVRALRSTARETIAQAARLGEQGRLEESIALHLRALEHDPGAAQAHINLISLYGRTGRADDAERHYRAALASNANSADAHYNYGVLLASLNRHSEALAAFKLAIAANPFHPAAHHNAGSLLLREGHVETAAQAYRRTLEADPGHRGARRNLARILHSQGRNAEALTHLQRVVADHPDRPDDLLALAHAYARVGERQQARECAERALAAAVARGDQATARSIRRELAAALR